MKQLFILLLAASTLVGCEDKKSKEWDFDSKISLRPAAGVKASKANPEHWSAERIVKEASTIWFWNRAITTQNAIARSFAPVQRDTINMRLLMWGTDIIHNGKYSPNFIEGEDMVLTKSTSVTTMDTIGYIPNKVLRDAQKVIKSAFDNGDYETVYAEFDQAFTFIPITGKEWQELKARGEN